MIKKNKTFSKKFITSGIAVAVLLLSSFLYNIFDISEVKAQFDGNSCYGSIEIQATNTRTSQYVVVSQYTGGTDNTYDTLDVNVGDNLSINASVSAQGPDCVISTAFMSGGGIFDETGNSYYNLGLFGGGSSTYTVGASDSGIYGETDVSCNYGGGGCYGSDYFGVVNIGFNVTTPPVPSFTTTCTPPTQTIATTASASYSISTTPSNGFNSPVTISTSISPLSGTIPTVSYINNGAVPGATTTVTLSTTNSTTPGTYTITFSASGGGVSNSCSRELIVSGPPPGFSFNITPGQASVDKGSNSVFVVTPDCVGGFNGTISNLSASSSFSNITYSFSNPSVTCGNSVNLTVSNTGAVPLGQLSPYGGGAIYQTITVTGQGN